ncbi:MAG: S-layer homology domain-containing protein [Clostridiaceae bacterium]|nr:S-layer homology domain-containing protein [Clostridiaceae bacterium]
MKVHKRITSVIITLCMAISLMPSINLTASAASPTPDCYITWDGTNYQLSATEGGAASTSNSALETVLSACADTNGDGLTIQLGNTETPLIVNGVATALKSATYTGSVNIVCPYEIFTVLYVPNGNTVTFNGLRAEIQDGSFSCYCVDIQSGGTLNLEGGSSLSTPVSDKYAMCVNNDGTLNIDGATVYGYYYGIYTTGTLNISESNSNIKTLISSSIMGVYSNNSLVNMSGGSISPVSDSIKQMWGLSANGGTVEISGGNISANDSSGSAISWNGNVGGIMTIDGNTIVTSSGSPSCAISSYNPGKLIIGGNAGITASGAYATAIDNINGEMEITENVIVTGTVSAVNNSSNGTVTMSGGTISSAKGDTLKNSGTVVITEGTVSNACVSTTISTITSVIKNQAGGSVTIDGDNALVRHTAGSYMADYGIYNEGTLSIKNGTVSCAGASYDSAAVCNFGAGTVSITGGSITATGTSGNAVSENFNATGTITVSDAPIISSASKYTIVYKYHSPESAALVYYGKTYYSSSSANITITGESDGSNHHVINYGNHDNANFDVQIMEQGRGFIAWTSDEEHKDYLSTYDNATISSLTSTENPSFDSVYLLLGATPSSIPTEGAFTDSDMTLGKINGDITWKAPEVMDDIDSYKIYWGSSDSTILSGSDVIATINKAVSKYTLALTALPEDAAYFLIFSTNASGNSTSALAVPITDVYTPFTVTGTVLKGASPMTNLSDISVRLYSSGVQTDYTAKTDASGSFKIEGVLKGTYTAVIETVSGSYAKSTSGQFTVSADCTGVDISLANPADEGYPLFVITKGPTTATEYYYVYEKKTSSGDFEPFNTDADEAEDTAYSSISIAMKNIRNEIVYGTATLYFGLTGTNSNNITGTLDINEDNVYLGTKGTYIIKGTLKGTGGTEALIYLKGSSLVVDGASIDCTGNDTIRNEGNGKITLTNGTVRCLGTEDNTEGCAIIAENTSLGDIDIAGGTVYSSASFAVENQGDGEVFVSGADTQISSVNMPAIHSDILSIRGGTITGSMAAVFGENVAVSGGNIHCENGPALYCFGNNSVISGGTLTSTNPVKAATDESMPGAVLIASNEGASSLTISGGTISNTAKSGYTVYNFNSDESCPARLYLSGKPKISGGETNIWTNCPIYASDSASASPLSYSGGALTLEYGGAISANSSIAVNDVTSGTNDGLFSIINNGYYLKLDGKALVINTYPASENFNSLKLDEFYTVPSDIGDWHYTMYNIAGTELCNSDFENGTEFFWIRKSASNSQALYCNSNSDGYVQLSSNAGEFHLISLVLQNVDSSESTDSFQIIGYKDNTAVKGATLTVQAAYGNVVSANLIGGSWYDIDQFRIYPMHRDDNVYSFNFYIDELVTEAPIIDTVPPTLSAVTPPDNAASVAVNTPLSLTFSEKVSAVSGKNIYIKKMSDSSTVQTIAVSDTSHISIDGAAVTIILPVSLENGTGYYIEIDAGAFQDVLGNAYAGLSGSTTWHFTTVAGSGTTPSGNSPEPSTAIPVGIGGTYQSIGEVSSSAKGGVTTVTVTADAGKLSRYISSAPSGSSVVFTVPQSIGSTVSNVDITLQAVGEMAQKSMTLDIKSGDITYSVPATAVDISATAATLGASNLADVTFAVSIAPASSGDAASLTVAASSEGFEVVSRAVTFTVTATYNGKSTKIENFGAFVARTIKLDSSIDPSKITTAITVDTDGSVRHIPTYVYKGADGCYYALVNSMTNSSYEIIYNVAEFTDAKGTWYEAQANEMASRKILTGITKGTFDGDNAITRAEFAAVLVRALGLPQSAAGSFSDVSSSSWYNGYVGSAYKTGIITGRSSTVFDPDANITREEAMAMLARAAKVSGYKGLGADTGTYSDLDKISSWAKDAVSFNLENGLILGSEGKIHPNDLITRAETATAVLRFLQKAGLVDIRSKV